MACRSRPSTMPRPPGTPTGQPGWSKASPSAPTPADAPRPPAGGSSGSPTAGWWSAIRWSPPREPSCRCWPASRRTSNARRSPPSAGWPRKGSRNPAPRSPGWRCCARSCAATAWTRCAPTPRPPSPGWPPGSPWSATALLLEGVADVLAGEADRADPVLAQAAELAPHISALPAASAALAQRALVAIARQDWIEAETLADRALEIARDRQLNDYEMSFATTSRQSWISSASR